MAAKGITVCVCGGGNAAHIACGMFADEGATVNMFFSFEAEAEKFAAGCKENDGVTIEAKDETFKGKPNVITHLPELAIPEADLVLMIVPAFAHESICAQIAPHLKKGAFVGAIPGPGAFDLLAKHTFGPVVTEKDITVFGGSSLPWACRFEEYGKRASLLGVKSNVKITSASSDPAKNAELEQLLEKVHKTTKFTCKGHFLVTTLWQTNAVIHTGISYGIWHDWDGKPLDEAPLFYQNTNEATGAILDGLSDENAKIAEVLQAAGADMTAWQPIDKYLLEVYGTVIADHSSTSTIFATNDAFRGLKAPVKTLDDGTVVPNFKTRYLTEDFPHGLAVMRGIAEICGVETPTMDKVLLWGQPLCGLEYLVDGKIQGKDVVKSGCPQRWGIKTVEELIAA